MPNFYIVGLEMVVRHLGNLAGGVGDLHRMRVTIGTPVPYAEAVHEGSRAHDILPRFKRALFWPDARHPVARVHHPGTRPNPWLRDVFEARRGAIIASIVSGLEEATRDGALHAAAGLSAAMDRTLEMAQEQAPQRTGTLRRSLHSEFYSR